MEYLTDISFVLVVALLARRASASLALRGQVNR